MEPVKSQAHVDEPLKNQGHVDVPVASQSYVDEQDLVDDPVKSQGYVDEPRPMVKITLEGVLNIERMAK